jgi:hypothetical protein
MLVETLKTGLGFIVSLDVCSVYIAACFVKVSLAQVHFFAESISTLYKTVE